MKGTAQAECRGEEEKEEGGGEIPLANNWKLLFFPS
jgi:hypothetical protein